MKKFLTALTALFTLTVSAGAMSYDRAREQALFLTDKMAYELNLSDDQYEAAYEVNLDYLMSINTYDDLYGAYWRNRNLDLSYILLDWQYRAFCAASYFYRPLYWHAGAWHFGIYARYPHRNYFYFGRPHFYVSYRGGHSWRHNGGRSWYHGRTYGRPHREGGHGMRDRFDRGDYHKGGHGNFNRGNGGHTGNRDGRFGNGSGRPDNRNGRFGGSNRGTTTGKPSADNREDKKPGNGNRPADGNSGHNRFGSGNTQNPGNSSGRSFGNRVTERESSTRSTVTRGESTHSGTRFGGNRVTSSPTRSVSSPTRSVTRPANTFTPRNSSAPSGRSAGMSHSSGGSRSSHGGGHFGGRR